MEKKKEILQKYKKPSNCDNVLVPKVNEEIWSKLPAKEERSDIRTSALQDTLVKVSSTIISLMSFSNTDPPPQSIDKHVCTEQKGRKERMP